jgi:hypothetical protein
MVISPLLDVSVSGRIRNFAAHLLDVRERHKSTPLNLFLLVLEVIGFSAAPMRCARASLMSV